MAVFGSRDEFAVIQVKRYLDILESRTGSNRFERAIIRDADHGFYRKKKEVASIVMDWVKHI